MNLRRASASLLSRWEPSPQKSGSSTPGRADSILSEFASSNQIDSRDYSLINATFLGCLRNLSLLDFWIGELRDGKVDREIRNLLRVGLCELLILKQQPHATVNECVSAARAKQSRGVINAVLRRADREREGLHALVENLPLAQRFSHPNFLVKRWTSQFGEDDTEALLRFNQTPSSIYVRPNPLRPDVDLTTLGVPLESPTGFYKTDQIPREALANGQCYIQDPSTAHAVTLLSPKAGERILDACAAPGGKASYIAALTNNKATLVVNEPDERRISRLTDNLERLGVITNSITQNQWGDTTTDTGLFDAILADVPCSNSGVIGRRVDVRWRLSREDFRRMPEIQRNILSDLLTRLAPGGRIVYSTCSIDQSENRDVVDAVLEHQPTGAFKLIEERHQLPFRDQTDGAYAALIQAS